MTKSASDWREKTKDVKVARNLAELRIARRQFVTAYRAAIESMRDAWNTGRQGNATK